MHTFPITVGAALVALTVATAAPGGTAGSPAADYAAGVTQICAGALLFDGAHQMGTHADALAIAEDIKASTARRLVSVTGLTTPPGLKSLSDRWVSSQRRLAALYAQLWVRIYDTIDAADTPAQRAALPDRLKRLVAEPDALKLVARHLEHALHVPDCTGGG
jgi:hypothetical protein